MPLRIVRNDITNMQVDAIVNAANETLLGGGGVDGCIHRAAGPELKAACADLGGCRVGEAKLTGGFALPCRYVIHTVGPVWQGGQLGEREALASCYRSALMLAQKRGCETVAFPLISSGAYGYPKDQALRVAIDTISGFLMDHDITVYLVIFDKQSFQLSEKLFRDMEAYIDDHYVAAAESRELSRNSPRRLMGKMSHYGATAACAPAALPRPVSRPQSLEEALGQMDESFSQMLLRTIDQRGLKDSQVYKKANIDRKLFSKIRKDPFYKPSKPTVLAFAIALELPLGETKELLMKAGYALSSASKFDIIVEYFIRQHQYDIFLINEALFYYDQSLLGG